MGIQAGMSQRGKSITSSVSPELFLLHSLACLQLLRKLARQVAFTFFESKDIFRELAMRAGREQIPVTTQEKPWKYYKVLKLVEKVIFNPSNK